ncbi:metallopeptidase TldD-related protein [Rhodococcus coprophilus]|uniref:Modulator of DNA gyrase, TldD n=1 Tax=Rhodococcus coprophilus TaxID=38310 RepID=A0A2X4TM88_9NOCA|nr:metallopeptidase TldD-related protein [Rhodococcus coprophilus]MBM7460862.1 putative Zn-dependent protease [Rhodococcus coprophilus]SQI28667.1 modulator of DNA gyrase, TldD [Rhodococcus coprophilus]
MISGPDLVEAALAASTADETIVLVTDTEEAALRWAGNSMTTNGSTRSRTVTVIAVRRTAAGARCGIVTASLLNHREIIAVVGAADAAARTAPPAADATDLVPGDGTPHDWDNPTEHTGIHVFDPVIASLAHGFDGSDVLYGFAEHQVHSTWLGTSTGLRRRWIQRDGSIEITGKRGGLDGASAWVGAGTTDFTDVRTDRLLEDLSRRLDWAATSVTLPAGRYETVLPPSAVADLMIYLMWSMEGRSAHEGHTVWSGPRGTRLGDTLTDLPLTLTSDPAAPGLRYAPFVTATASSDAVSIFDNGLPAGRVDWIRDGAVHALTYPRAAAAEFAATPTAPGRNLLLTGGSAATLDEMIAGTERGLLLTTLWYLRDVDPASLLLTGLTRDGVYLIEDGRVRGAVGNFRFNESPVTLLGRATEVGATERTLPREWKDWFTRTSMPPMRIPDFHMSSVSAAH